ncbi:MAG: hypothetical protein LQ347_003820 [Umbilicaria vellea]|nr:MAG: hypothetical protein LQ347_003820 [Umbilicaria vellea]
MAPKDNSQAAMGSAVSYNGPERRRSSASAAKFAGLMNQKRNSTDEMAAARKASFAEQAKAPGFVGGLWNR